jgi:hypothetical protein
MLTIAAPSAPHSATVRPYRSFAFVSHLTVRPLYQLEHAGDPFARFSNSSVNRLATFDGRPEGHVTVILYKQLERHMTVRLRERGQ